MITVPYRYRRGLQRFFISLSVVFLLGVLAIGAWMLWLSRYVIYTEDGAKLDFNLSFDYSQGEPAQTPTQGASLPLIYGNTDDLLNPQSSEPIQLNGVVVTEEMLTNDLAAVESALTALPTTTPILMDMKSIRGEYFYTSAIGRTAETVDTSSVTRLILDLKAEDRYLIARIPAFREYWFFMEDQSSRVPYGLPKSSGSGALWEDKSVPKQLHYWLNPASTGTLDHLVQIITELRNLGFDEVVLEDFRFPYTDGIRFTGDKEESLNEAAKTLSVACTNEHFVLSFVNRNIALPEGRCRIYVTDVVAADIPELVAGLSLEKPQSQLVFLTDLMDTRYDAYSVLRPLEIPSVS